MLMYNQACQQEREKKAENCLCALSRLAKPAGGLRQTTTTAGGAVIPPKFVGILDVLRVNLFFLFPLYLD